MNIIRHKNIFFLISGIVIVPGVISLFLFGLKPAIDFTGGSRGEYQISSAKNPISNRDIQSIIESEKIKVHTVRKTSNNTFLIRTEALDQKQKSRMVSAVEKKYGKVEERSFETVGPSIGRETTSNAAKAVIIASVVITLYIAYAFRKVSKPVASWKFGVAAIVALLHDVLVVVGIFSLLGRFIGVEVDSLFITALLTVMGFSVHDTIVVFDRIRENIKKSYSVPFPTIVNNSILETMNRSLNTSLTVIIVLFALLLFGGESIKWFVVALLVGIISGTYSSIFNASPLLVLWYEWDRKRVEK